jgi:hypothetical protein
MGSRILTVTILTVVGLASAALAQPPQRYDELLAKANAIADSNCADAEGWYARAIAARPTGLEAIVGSGTCFAERRKFGAAHARFRAALAISPIAEGALWGIAEALRREDKRDEAVAAYRNYLGVFPTSYKARVALEQIDGGDPATAPPAEPTAGHGPVIAINGAAIEINGFSLSTTPQLSDVVALIGPWDRVWDKPAGINKVYTWDRLGVLAYEPKDGRCVSLTLPFAPMNMDYDPAQLFTGTFSIDGQALHRQTTLATLKARPGATQPYANTSVVFPRGEFNIFTMGKVEGGTIDLVELSLWKKPVTPVTAASPATVPQISVSGGAVTLNGTAISNRPTLVELEVVFGKADRIWDKGTGNRIHTWDALGLLVYEPRDGRAISATFPFKAMKTAFDPKTAFAGSIVVDGDPLGAGQTLAQIKARTGATQPYSASSIVFDFGELHVFTKSDDGATLDLVELGFWQKPSSGAGTGKPARTDDVSVVVTGTRVTLNGATITGTPMLADFIAVLGKPDRVWEKRGAVNRIHTWDRLGVVVYEPHDGRAISATFPFRPLGTEFDARTRFGGAIAVDGTRLGATTTFGVVKRLAGAAQPYGAGSVVLDKADLHVFAKADGDAATLELVELSFWQRRK